ncbi:MAG: hypothetical protein ACFCVK_10860 [Acidimicrobiales bacterium]
MVLALAVIAVASWGLFGRGDAGEAVSSTTTIPTTAAPIDTTAASQPVDTADTTSPPNVDPDPTGEPEDEVVSPAVELVDVLIGTDDLEANMLVLEEGTREIDDPDHPLRELAVCSTQVDLTGVGAGANRVLVQPTFGPTTIVASSVTVTESPERARAVASDILAAARSCTEYTNGLAEVSIGPARGTGRGQDRLIRLAEPVHPPRSTCPFILHGLAISRSRVGA